MRSGTNRDLIKRFCSSVNWRQYRKTKPVWIRQLTKELIVDTHEGSIKYPAGHYVCRGPSGDVWGQSAESIQRKYKPDSETQTDNDGWMKYLPRQDDEGVLAIAVDHDFSVDHHTWGKLNGKAGDFLVKKTSELNHNSSDAMWIVKRDIFKSTYEEV